MTLSYFIYYRVAPEHSACIVSRVRGMQAEVAAATGVAGRLLQKDDSGGTWMEIYEEVADGPAFEGSLQQAALRAGLQELLVVDGKRQLERFAAVD
jgi:hypothetical protein